jgi:heme/copper-type cytochrome/quinol oxidase subunit 3
MLTGFHGIHVIMELYLFCSIYTNNKDHLQTRVIWALKRLVVLAFCRWSLAVVILNVYLYGGNFLG